jgi:hypothetical protein
LAIHQHQYLARIDSLNLLATGGGGFGAPARQDTRHFAQELRHCLRSALLQEAPRQHRHIGVEALAQLLLAGRRNDLHGLNHRRRRKRQLHRLSGRHLHVHLQNGEARGDHFDEVITRIDWGKRDRPSRPLSVRRSKLDEVCLTTIVAPETTAPLLSRTTPASWS